MQGVTPKVYKQEKLSFVIIGDKIIVYTNLQAFYLQPKAHYWRRRMYLIEAMIELGEVRNLSELASWTNPGIDWVSTSVKVDNLTPMS
jgi:hypothetical protein